VVKKRFARIEVRAGGPILAPMGSCLKVESAGRRTHSIVLPDGRIGRIAAAALRTLSDVAGGSMGLRAILKEVLGVPYLWGGRSTFGFDCSGLVQFVFETLGTRLPRDSKDQAERGRLIGDLKQLRPLDLIFFGSAAGVDHVAVHLGGLEMVHSSGYVRVESLARTSRGFRPDLLQRFRFARRVLRV
jgi:cell wall-associated NlpC family hydrolase